MSTIDAPVDTITSTMLFLTSSTYRSMQPPAEVEPAMVRMLVDALSFSMVLKISQARPRSREVNDMSLICLIIGRASNDLMSMCLTGLDSRSALRLFFGCGLTDFNAGFFAFSAGFGVAFL